LDRLMRFESLKIANLRAVRYFEINELSNLVVIAGQNGCGKSCVFDAIRLLKSVYGGAQDEHMQWFGEFAINVHDRGELRRVFRDPTQPIVIEAVIEFAESEREYMGANAEELLWPLAWQRVTGQRIDPWTFSHLMIGPQLAQWQQAVEPKVAELAGELRGWLQRTQQYQLGLMIRPDGGLERIPCPPAEAAFPADEPDHLGIIEYHSASRAYTRQPIGGINLDAKSVRDQRRQQRLYNWQAKYQNVKTELATSYLRNIIAERSGEPLEERDLNETLKELFQSFFPDKVYEGVRPSGGSLEFPVRLPGGERHDIDDLSSGEKEILYGYLRLRNSTPRQSVILLDEPELHLNPSLLQGFTDFYHRHLGIAQENQLLMVTHSDTLLRQAVGNANYRVYHMTSANPSDDNQATEVLLDDDMDRVIVDLVGDLAAYRPRAKVVILEGDEEGGFDVVAVSRLFPDFAKRVNLVSAGAKRRVRDLYALLETYAQQANVENRFFAVVDRDAERDGEVSSGARVFAWDVYHIENYLLDPSAIREAIASIDGKSPLKTDEKVLAALEKCAAEIIDAQVVERIRKEVNREIVGSISVGCSPRLRKGTTIGANMRKSIDGSVERVNERDQLLSADALDKRVTKVRKELEKAIDTGAWKKKFPGREVLKAFVSKHVSGASYETFRNLILDKMTLDETRRPTGMRAVLGQIEHVEASAEAPSRSA
jgi:predicted ATPase